jgi:hypothetical protein
MHLHHVVLVIAPSSCINSGLFSLPVTHLSLFWLLGTGESSSPVLVIDLLTSGFVHRSTSALLVFDISLAHCLCIIQAPVTLGTVLFSTGDVKQYNARELDLLFDDVHIMEDKSIEAK